uniref:Prolyl endopeptidase n=1 Tax=Chromera velia CCMP2878 TaxID=1169474 RepID=A0A0G4GQP5_9ALVE|eukprot:Cvel_5061.t1-p1 / transcript=Cvel_5061.t1 / gene=Cvel_5061 / organism=Chromera_velia_CCMP2878 / gene_product=Uncharacterized peptidase y4nA, putative / transcript_product=Uncharacterized peptidase y4nA, putative / location=Cvel_scaffold230:94622-100814(+) / protein_length=831 / sequence_SO=supercontig / SO=protein_coding / is_pseudo=false
MRAFLCALLCGSSAWVSSRAQDDLEWSIHLEDGEFGGAMDDDVLDQKAECDDLVSCDVLEAYRTERAYVHPRLLQSTDEAEASEAETDTSDGGTEPLRVTPGGADPFLWLEDVNGPRALGWVERENNRTLSLLESDDRYQTFFDDIAAIAESRDRIVRGSYRGGVVSNFWQDGDHVRGIWRVSSLSSFLNNTPEWEVILDIDALAASEGENWVFKGARCLEPEYNLCVVSLSRGGTDASVRREFEVSSKRFIPEEEGGFVLSEAKSRFAWVDKDTVAVATDFGEDSLTVSGYPRILKLWRRGEKVEDAETIHTADRNAVLVAASKIDDALLVLETLSMTDMKTYALKVNEWTQPRRLPIPVYVTVSQETAFNGHVVLKMGREWTFDPDAPFDEEKEETQEAEADGQVQAAFLSLSEKGEERTSPSSSSTKQTASRTQTFPAGSLVSVNMSALLETGRISEVFPVFIPDERTSVSTTTASENFLFVNILRNVASESLRFVWDEDEKKWKDVPVPLPRFGSGGVTSANKHSDVVFASYSSMISPSKLYLLDPVALNITELQSLPAFFNATDLTVEQWEATSTDGVQVPYFIAHKKDMQFDGTNPVLQYGYGGFRIPLLPRYSAATGKVWLERGGVYVLANIRGGGEFGPTWHAAALTTRRQTSFDDFQAVSKDLIARNVTSPSRLAISGGSNGGLLVGVTFTQAPELYNAVLCDVPLLDMLRYHRLLAGASWMGEYGNPEVPEERTTLIAYSPYHNVLPDEEYPKVFFRTSTKDDRVHPGHARKMAALMAAQGHPMYYYENTEGGHSAAANLRQVARRGALGFTYLSKQLMDH